MTLPAAFAPLGKLRRFVTYRLDPDLDRPGKTHKRPTNWRTGETCNAHDPANQCSYDEAFATGRPVGFVFVAEDGYFFIDIDSAYDGVNWSPRAIELVTLLGGAAVEVSQSNTGLHIIGRGVIPDHACKNIHEGLELYHTKRFVALTFKDAKGSVDFDGTAQLAVIVPALFPPAQGGSDVVGWGDGPVEGYTGTADDAELYKIMMASGKKDPEKVFGDKCSMSDFWHCNVDKLAKAFPPTGNGDYDASSADMSFFNNLAFWTGKDPERMRRLAWDSDLWREKWEREDYLETTILKACAFTTNVFTPKPAPVPPGAAGEAIPPSPGPTPHPDNEGPQQAAPADTGPTILLRTGRDYLTTEDQIAFFAGCVYVTALHKIWVPGTGDLLDKPRFDVVYAGHTLTIDGQGQKTTDSAWDAVTKSRVYVVPVVDRTCFRPEHPAGAVIREDGRSLVNIYIPINTPKKAGDPSKYLNHLRKMYPVERDFEILMSWKASVIQNPGMKAQWWPVLQGVEGNGKSLEDRVMSFCVGSRYSHLVNPDAMAKTGNQFNSWIQGNLYVGFEEIYVQQRRDFLESLKATVTNSRVTIEAKGVDQATGDNRINGMMFTNHLDAVPITTDTRRYCILYSSQQTAADLIRDGMDGAYFPDLYDWLNGRGIYAEHGENHGYAIVNQYMSTLAIAVELDPAKLCVRAPETSSTNASLRHSLGRAEQEVLEAIAEGRQGFSGGWVSSMALDRLLDGIRAPVARNKRADMLRMLGFERHPGLGEGRVNNTIMPDNGKPTLYITTGHLSASLDDPVLIAKAYTAAQTPAKGHADNVAQFNKT